MELCALIKTFFTFFILIGLRRWALQNRMKQTVTNMWSNQSILSAFYFKSLKFYNTNIKCFYTVTQVLMIQK